MNWAKREQKGGNQDRVHCHMTCPISGSLEQKYTSFVAKALRISHGLGEVDIGLCFFLGTQFKLLCGSNHPQNLTSLSLAPHQNPYKIVRYIDSRYSTFEHHRPIYTHLAPISGPKSNFLVCKLRNHAPHSPFLVLSAFGSTTCLACLFARYSLWILNR
jgi:hypothetical protein